MSSSDDDSDGGDQFGLATPASAPAPSAADAAPSPPLIASRRDSRRDSKLIGRGSEASKLVQLQLEFEARHREIDEAEGENDEAEEEEQADKGAGIGDGIMPGTSSSRKKAAVSSNGEGAARLSQLAKEFELRKTAADLVEGEAGIAADLVEGEAGIAPPPVTAPTPVPAPLRRSSSARARARKRKTAALHIRAFDRVFEPSKLLLTLLGARHLASTIGALFAPKPDPFVVVRLDGLEVARSKILRATAQPEWRETLEVLLPLDRDYTDCVLELKVYDANDGIGEMKVRAGVEEDDGGVAGRKASLSPLAAPPSSSSSSSSDSRRRSSFVATVMGIPERDGVARFLGKVTFSGAQQLTWLGSAASNPDAAKWLPLYNKKRSGKCGDVKIMAQLIPGDFRDVPRPALDDDDTVHTLHTDGFFSVEDETIDGQEGEKGGKDGEEEEGEEEEGEEEEEEEESDDCIEVTVLAAKNLGKADLLGLSDPYAVVFFNGVEIGRSTVVDNCLYPRWQGQSFRVVVPAGAGVYYEGKDSVLRVDVYDSNATRDDVFLGCCVVDKAELENLLGLKGVATANVPSESPDFRCRYADQIERGAPMWFPLVQDKARTMQQNKFVRGGLQLAGAYISGTPDSSPPPPRRLSIHIEAAAGLAKTGAAANKSSLSSSLSGLLSSSSKKAASEEAASTSSFCVVYFNGSVVGRTHVVKNSYDPCFHSHFLVTASSEWDLRLCWLEVEVYGEASVAGKLTGSAAGPFLGATVVRGQELIELLRGRLTLGGEHVIKSFPLRPSEHLAKDDQALVRGSVSLRGSLDDVGRQHPASWLEAASGGGESSVFGRLVVGVAEAASLAQTDRFGTTNAFVQATWNGRLRGATSVVPNQLNPTWESENEFFMPLPVDVQLTDCVLEFRVQDKSRLGKLSLLGEKRLTGEALEALVQLRGELQWLDLEPSRYLGEKGNALVQGSLRVRCQYLGSLPSADSPTAILLPPLARKSYQPARVRVKALGIAEIAPLSGLKSMAALTSRSAPFLQLLWNGREVGCTTPLSISALVLDDAEAATRVHEWKDESFCFFLGEHLIEDSRLEVVGWDCGLLTSSGQHSFLGRRVLTGPELARAVFHTTDYAAIIAGQVVPENAEPRWLALGRTWDLPLEEQTSVRPRVLLDVAFEPEHFAELAEEELDAQEEEESARLLAMALEEGSPSSREEGGRRSDALQPSGEEKRESRAVADDTVTLGTSSTDELYTEEELAQQERQRRDEQWERLKTEHRIIIPPGALHYFTKHYEEQRGKFYYYDHVTGLATYDRPPGELRLHKMDQQLDDLRVNLEARARGAESAHKERAALMLKLKAEKDAAVAYHLNQKRANEAREQKKVWHRVVDDGASNHGSVSIAWQNFGYIDPMIYSFGSTMGMPLLALRLVGMGLTELPADFGQKLPSLEILSLSNNSLTRLPDSMVLLTNLKELNLLRNRLVALPDRIGLMCSLLRLELANNVLQRLPITFGALNMMERVDAECNELAVLPENLDNMTSCRFFNVNHNKLQRLPRCLSRMPSLTSLSATHNLISYIPADLTGNINIKVLRLSCNRITVVPEQIGQLKRLREISLDWNLINTLPLTFYQLRRLKTCRVDGNPNLGDPPPDVCVLGAQGIVEYFRRRYEDDITYRMRKIISAVQGLLQQVVERGLADPSLFEPDSRVEGSDDPWYALQLSYFWSDLVPAMRKVWQLEGGSSKFGAALNSFTYDEKEVLWAFQNFNDAYGAVFKRQKALFRRCACVDVNGKRRPCVPPKVGFYCSRVATLFKARVVMHEVRKERLWLEQKRAGVAEAVSKAEKDAQAYLVSKQGKLWLETEAYKRAEAAMEAMGGATADKWRKKAADKHKSVILDYYDKKRVKVEAIRDKKAAEWNEELDRARNDLKGAREGYMKNSLQEQVVTLTNAIASMPENAVIRKLALECERKCADVDDEWADADSTDSSDSDAELVSSGDESPGAERRRARYKRRYLESKRSSLKRRVNKEVEEYYIPPDPLEAVVNGIYAAWSVLWPRSENAVRKSFKARRRYKRWVRNLFDVVDIRVRKWFMTVGGTFDEVQKECKHELFRQYLQSSIDMARQKAQKEFSLIDEIRQNMGGVGVEKIFRTWKKWALNKAQRLRRDARAEYKSSVKVFDAAMESVRIAQARAEMWKKNLDIYSDQPFWIHELTGQITLDRPGLEHFLPPAFEMPHPPGDLPENISYDTSESEDENAWKAERRAGAKAVGAAGAAAEDISSDSDQEQDDDEVDEDDEDDEHDDDDENDDDDDDDDEEKDDMSAMTGATRLVSVGPSPRLPAIVPTNNVPGGSLTGDAFIDGRRRMSDVLSPREWPGARGDDATVHGAAASVVSGKTTSSGFSYGPDSLRTPMQGRVGRAHFQNPESAVAPPTQLEMRVEVARQFIREKLARGDDNKGRSRRGGIALPAIIETRTLAEVAVDIKDRMFNETKKADQKLRKMRTAISQARHDTYMEQANRLPRSLEDNVARAKAAERVQEVYKKPEVAAIFEMAGANHETMNNVLGHDGVKLRTLVAYRALHVKKKLHDRAVRARLKRPAKMNLVGTYIAPIWRENYVGSSDEDEDDEEVFAAKAERKRVRKEARAKKAEQMLEAEEHARASRKEGEKAQRTFVPVNDWARVGKPRDVQTLTVAAEKH